MHEGIQINRMADRFSSHTLAHARPAGYGASRDTGTARPRPIGAAIGLLAERGDPRLVESRVLP